MIKFPAICQHDKTNEKEQQHGFTIFQCQCWLPFVSGRRRTRNSYLTCKIEQFRNDAKKRIQSRAELFRYRILYLFLLISIKARACLILAWLNLRKYCNLSHSLQRWGHSKLYELDIHSFTTLHGSHSCVYPFRHFSVSHCMVLRNRLPNDINVERNPPKNLLSGKSLWTSTFFKSLLN